MCNFYPADLDGLCRKDNLNPALLCRADAPHHVVPISVQLQGGKRTMLEHAPVPHKVYILCVRQQSQHVLYCYFHVASSQFSVFRVFSDGMGGRQITAPH